MGLEVLGELMESEVAEVAGPKGKHNAERAAYRHGGEDGSVTLGGRKVEVRRPRVRSVDGAEVHLESYDTLASVDLLTEHAVAAMLAGLSTRRYGASLEPVGAAVEETASSTSRSAVSRRFVAATAAGLAEFRSRAIEGRFLVCFVDGFDFAGHTMVGALGVTAEGTKTPLGVVEGSTENATVVRGLISGLRDRGLNADGGILFVLDCGKVWNQATSSTFDQPGRLSRLQTPTALIEPTHDAAGRVETEKLDGSLVADPAYNVNGELASVACPGGIPNRGNGSSLAAVTRDGAGRLTELTWKLSDNSVLSSDVVTRSQAGRIVDETIDGVDPNPGMPNFAYDPAGRLTSATVPGHTIAYNFASSGGCGSLATAGRNTDRTSVTDNGATTTSCYDSADRLTSTTPSSGSISYDAHGNTTVLGPQAFSFDGADRHVQTTSGPTSVRYLRGRHGQDRLPHRRPDRDPLRLRRTWRRPGAYDELAQHRPRSGRPAARRGLPEQAAARPGGRVELPERPRRRGRVGHVCARGAAPDPARGQAGPVRPLRPSPRSDPGGRS